MMKLLPVSVVVVVVADIIVTSQAATVLVHQDVTLTCSIGPAAPRSSAVFWYSNGIHEYLTSDFTTINELNNTARSVYQRLSAVGSEIRGKYNLRITDVRAEDEGVYLCGYYQPNGTWFTVKTEKLEVLIPPGREFPSCSVQTSSDALLAPGMLVNLTCISYGGSPPANLVWYRAGVRMEGVAAHGGLWVYLQHRLLEEDSGVEFTCQATSPALSEPKSCSITPYRRASQLYIKHEHEGLVAMGESATFTCASRDILLHGEEVYYRWYINGVSVEDGASKTMITDDGKTLTLLNVTTGDDKSTVSCEEVDELTARSSASMAILVVSPSSLMNHPVLYLSEQPDYCTKDPPRNIAGITIGAFLCGMFLMLFLVFVLWLAASARRRGRLDISHKSSTRQIFVGWQKIVPKTTEVEKLNHCAIDLEKSSPVRTFKKPFISGKPANGNSYSAKGVTVHRDDHSGCNGVGVTTPPPSSVSQNAKIAAASHDPLPTYKKPSPLRLMSESGRPLLLASPAGSRSRGYSVDRDYTASMPDLALRYFGDEPKRSTTLDHDYVNLPAVPSSKDGSGSSPPSYVNCEFASSIPPKSSKLSLPRSNPQRKSLSYAELDLPCVGDRPPTPLSPMSPADHKTRAGSVSVERTNYAEIAYVFKDRRQQSLPSVKLVGLSEGFGVKV